MEDWNTLPNGEIESFPVLEFQMMCVPSNVVMKLDWIASEAELEAGKTRRTQLHLHADFARQLAAALIEAAEGADGMAEVDAGTT